MIYSERSRWIIVGFVLATLSLPAKAEVLFEGYSKIYNGGIHVGYTVSRYEFDTKKKVFTSTYFLKTNELGGNVSESLKAVADEKFGPISYSYTTLIGKETKTIDAKIKNNKLVAEVKSAQGNNRIIKDLPKGTFLSTFLGYVMLASPQGLKPETKYNYQAIAEEDADVYKGLAIVKASDDPKDPKALKVINEFKKIRFYSFINQKGEVLSTRSPEQGISTELVSLPTMATMGFGVPAATLKSLFGDVPTGTKNQVWSDAQQQGVPGKQFGIPQGKGIQLKTEPSSKGK